AEPVAPPLCDPRRARSGPTGLAMLGALHRDDVRARRSRTDIPSSAWRAGSGVRVRRPGSPQLARRPPPQPARGSMKLVPTLSIERAGGAIRYRLDVPERDLGEPLQEEFRHPIDDVTTRALLTSAESLLRSPESSTFAQEAQARGQVLYRTLVPPRLREKLRTVTGPLLISTSLYGLPWELLHDEEEFWGLRYGLGKRLVLDRPLLAGPPAARRRNAPHAGTPARARHRVGSARRSALRPPRGRGHLRDPRAVRRHRVRRRSPGELRDRRGVSRRGLRSHPLLWPRRQRPGHGSRAAPRRRTPAVRGGDRAQRPGTTARLPERMRQRARAAGTAERRVGSDRVERGVRLPLRRRSGRRRHARRRQRSARRDARRGLLSPRARAHPDWRGAA